MLPLWNPRESGASPNSRGGWRSRAGLGARSGRGGLRGSRRTLFGLGLGSGFGWSSPLGFASAWGAGLSAEFGGSPRGAAGARAVQAPERLTTPRRRVRHVEEGHILLDQASIAFQYFVSSFVTMVKEWPSRPARPVRPMRWT